MILALLGCSCSDPTPPVAPPVDAGDEIGEVIPGPDTVVLIIGCTLRADRMGVYGNPRATTPYLDALAAEGAVFENMVSNAPWTRPSIGSISTGRYPLVLGIDDPAPAMNTTRGVHPDFETIGEAFQADGWTTVGSIANPNANAVFGMGQGFDTYHEAARLWREEHSKVSGADIVDEFLDIASAVEGRLYGQLVVIDTHRPLPIQARRPTQWGMEAMLDPTDLDKYDAALTLVDALVKQLDEGLAKLGREDRVLFFIGDHGEGMNSPEWAGRAHGRFLYDANVATPWIAHGPGVKAGNRVTGLAENVDIKPTLLDMLNVPSTFDTDGDSRAQVLAEGLSETGETGVFTETYFAADHRARWTTDEWTFINNYTVKHHRGVEERGRFELYAADDEEQAHDLYREQIEVGEALSLEMEKVRKSSFETQKVWTGEELSGDMQQALEALGYVEGGDGAPPEE